VSQLKQTKDVLLQGSDNFRQKSKTAKQLAQELVNEYKDAKSKALEKIKNDKKRFDEIHKILSESSKSMFDLKNKPAEKLAEALVEKYKILKKRIRKRVQNEPLFSVRIAKNPTSVERKKRAKVVPTSSSTDEKFRPESVPLGARAVSGRPAGSRRARVGGSLPTAPGAPADSRRRGAGQRSAQS
jgi:gamma-glutamyl phosphate reductase